MLRIIIEGVEDASFLESFLERKLKKSRGTHFDFVSSGGWSKLSELSPQIEEFHDAGDTIVVVFDADSEDKHSNGGHSKRLEKLRSILNEQPKIRPLASKIDIFLFPNNGDDGDLEVLLEGAVPADKRYVFDCFENYLRCVASESNRRSMQYVRPNQKSKIFAYTECFPKSKTTERTGKEKRSAYHPDYWDFYSLHLTPLLQFFERHFEASQAAE